MDAGRFALIIGNSEYEDQELRRLLAPESDAESLARVLGDPAIGGFQVQKLLNATSGSINQAIEEFFVVSERRREDLLLLYFSGHGIKDDDGQLYFAARDTRLIRHRPLRATAVAAGFVSDMLRSSRSRRQILLLDCCYSGAFAKALMTKGDATVGVRDHFQEGRGLVVLTASDSLQYSLESAGAEQEGTRSVFTSSLVRAIETGEADRDGDGSISLDELYEYVLDRVTQETPQQRPRKWDLDVEGRIYIARSPAPVKSAPLPPELLDSIEDRRPWVRLGAVQELRGLLAGSHRGLAMAALEALRKLEQDDSRHVRDAAAQGLAAPEPPRTPPAPEPAPPAAAAPSVAPAPEPPPPAPPPAAPAGNARRFPKRKLALGQGLAAMALAAWAFWWQGSGKAPRPGSAAHAPQPRPAQANGVYSLAHVLGGHTGEVMQVAFRPDGKVLVSAAQDSTVKLWELPGGNPIASVSISDANAAAFSPDGRLFAAAGDTGAVGLYDGSDGRAIAALGDRSVSMLRLPDGSTTSEHIYAVDFTPDGHLLAAAQVSGLCIYDAARRARVSGPEVAAPLAVAFSPDGHWLAVSGNALGRSGPIRIFRVGSWTVHHILRPANDAQALAFSPDSKLLASGGEDKAVTLWDTDTGQQVRALPGVPGKVRALAFRRDGRELAAGASGTVVLWDTGNWSEIQRLPHEAPAGSVGQGVNSVAFSPDGKLLATGGMDKARIRLWRVQ